MPWQCLFKKLCFFPPIMPKIMLTESAKAYSYSLHRWEETNDSKSGYRKRSFKFLWRKWTQLHPNTFRDCRVQFSDNLSRTSCTTSPSPFKRLPRRHRRVIGFYDVLETFNLRACALQWTIVIVAVWRENVVHARVPAQAAQTLWEFVGLWIYKRIYENKQDTS